MIASVAGIKNLGIYKDFKRDSSLDLFNKHNLIYGWNGSGKSTLSRLFSFVQKGIIPEEFWVVSFKYHLKTAQLLTKNWIGHRIYALVFLIKTL